MPPARPGGAPPAALRDPGEVEQQLAWALGMWRKHRHAYDAGYADALAWVLGRAAPSKAPEGLDPGPAGAPGSGRAEPTGHGAGSGPGPGPRPGAR